MERFVVFSPHYALHSSEGIFILSGDKIKRLDAGNSIAEIDIFPSILSILKIKYYDKDLKGKPVFK